MLEILILINISQIEGSILGASKHWEDALEQLTGEREMSSRPILKFFEPLQKWLIQKNKENGDKPGWS